MWVSGARHLVRIDAAGRITYQPVPQGPARLDPHGEGIVAGPDGALWFADHSAPGFGRYFPGQPTVQEFPMPGSSIPDGIAVGPDRAIWLTDPGARKITRLGPDNAIMSLALGDAVEPGDIAAGPDNALWVADLWLPRILEVQTLGAEKIFPVDRATNVLALTVGPDGALWFAPNGAPIRIDRMTLDGRVREFKLPLPADDVALILDIAVGPDGNLWFTENASGAIGRITLDGRITMFRMLRWSPEDIAAGPDNAIWFTNDHDDVVGRVPANVCASRRVIRLHLRAPRHKRIVSVRVTFGNIDQTVRGRSRIVPVPIDLRGYIGGVVRVHIRVTTGDHHRTDAMRTFHTCR
jgi:virginiamycin B lyase